MEEFFDYHIEEKEMSPKLLTRSFKIYIEQFDPYYAYLLEEEVSNYVKPTPTFLDGVLKDYNDQNYTAYFTLNKKIEKSITRARTWRTEWMQDPHGLIVRAQELNLDEGLPEVYPLSTHQLKKHHETVFVRLIRIHLDDLDQTLSPGREGKLIALCEKKMAILENQYLGLHEDGRKMNSDEQEP